MIFCTSISANYLPKARVLAASLRAFQPGARLVICLLERSTPSEAAALDESTELLRAEELGIERFEAFVFRHSLVEAATAIKGRLLARLLERGEPVVYLDPDVLVLSRLVELEEMLDAGASIVLTPHIVDPETTHKAVEVNEMSALRHGVFNLGFLALAPTAEARRFLAWWVARLDEFCRDDRESGVFTDQKWVDLAPGFFAVSILRHPGYNLAPWNFSTRPVQRRDGQLLTLDQPLRFVHFSGFDSGAFHEMLRFFLGAGPGPIHELAETYARRLAIAGQATLGALPWSYDFYLSGERVLPEARARLRDDLECRAAWRDPYLASNREVLGQG